MSGIDPLINFRAVDENGSELAFFEAHVIPGPEVVGDIGNGTQRERYGFNWLVMLTADRVPVAYREVPNGSGNWVQVTDLLPPVFGTVLPVGSRRLSAVFDQSGRLAICYEHEGLVRVTRWDVETQQYVQNVTFPGTNPALAIDLQAGIPVGDSDVQVYYQPVDDLTQVRCRIQRDLYLTVYTVWDGSVPLILDRVIVSWPQLQLFVSDTMGNPLRDEAGQLVVLAGPYYPLYVQDAVRLDAVPTVGVYEETTLVRSVEDAVMLDATVLNPFGLSGEPIYEHVRPSPTGIPPSERMQQVELFNGSRLTDRRLAYLGVNWPTCNYTGGETVGLDEYAIGTSGMGMDIEDERDLNFDAVILTENLMERERYGVRGFSLIFDTLWVITRQSSSQNDPSIPMHLRPLEPAIMWKGAPDPNPEQVCTVHSVWQAGSRTLVVEIAQSRFGLHGNEGNALEWHEVWRTTEEPPAAQPGEGGLWQERRQYSFYADISLLASPAAPFVHVRVRTLDASGNNSTHVYLLGGWHVQLDMLSNAYVGNVLQRSVQDAVALDAQPTVVEYRDNTHMESLSDGVFLDAAPTVAEYVMHVVANPQPVDHVILDATPTVAIYREV